MVVTTFSTTVLPDNHVDDFRGCKQESLCGTCPRRTPRQVLLGLSCCCPRVYQSLEQVFKDEMNTSEENHLVQECLATNQLATKHQYTETNGPGQYCLHKPTMVVCEFQVPRGGCRLNHSSVFPPAGAPQRSIRRLWDEGLENGVLGRPLRRPTLGLPSGRGPLGPDLPVDLSSQLLCAGARVVRLPASTWHTPHKNRKLYGRLVWQDVTMLTNT